MNTEEDLEEAQISFIVSKYWVTRTMSMISFVVVPGTFSEKATTLSLVGNKPRHGGSGLVSRVCARRPSL
jgi:hypothetical protein